VRAAVTGSAGFIGRAIVAALIDRGDSVVALLRKDHVEPEAWRGRADIFRSDLATGPPTEAMRDVEVVFHCAAQVRPTWEREAYIRNNVRATCSVFEAALTARVRRVVHFSSLAVHGEHIDHRDANESASFANPPPNPYVETKIESERVVEEFRGRGLNVVVLRPGWVWGPGDSGAACIEVGSRLMRRDPFLTRYQVAILARNQGFSIAKARGTLGFRPEVTLDEALARTARWITESFPAK